MDHGPHVVAVDLYAARQNSDVADLVDIEISSYYSDLKLISGWGSPYQVFHNKKFKSMNMTKIRELDFNLKLSFANKYIPLRNSTHLLFLNSNSTSTKTTTCLFCRFISTTGIRLSATSFTNANIALPALNLC